MEKMKLNKFLIWKMANRIETMPETYDQGNWYRRVSEGDSRPVPACGVAGCLAGEAIISNEQTVAKGVARLRLIMTGTTDIDLVYEATRLMGVEGSGYYLFSATANSWPPPFSEQFQNAKTYKGEACAAVNLLRAILRTDGKILENA